MCGIFNLNVTYINLSEDIQLIMAAAKTATKGTAKGRYICAECDTEFTGAKCPECGNGTGNQKLAPDGIEQRHHTTESVFGNVNDLEGYVRTTDDEFLMEVQNAKMARAEFTENLRQSQLNASEVKKLESERKLIQKRSEVDRVREGFEDTFAPGEQSSGPSEQFPQQPLFGAQSPQAQFMSQLMRMDGDRRAEFMEQLSDADPAALNQLSSMFVQPQSNPMGQQPGMPGMYQQGMYPPWMMQQQPQQEPQPQESTTSVMREMFSLMKDMQPEKDNSAVEIIRDLKDEIKSLHSRLDGVNNGSNGGSNASDPIIQYIQQLEKKIENTQQRPSFSEQAHELRNTIQDLESIGLVNNNTGISVEDKIRMKEVDHQIDMETKQFLVDQEAVDIEKGKQKVREDFTKRLFTQSFSPVPEVETPVNQPQQANPFFNIPAPKVLTKPSIVDTIESDEGTVHEVRTRPVNDGGE